MRKNIFALFILLVLSGFSSVNATNIQYSLKMPKPQNHYFEVEMLIEDYKAAHGLVDEAGKIELQKWYLHDKGISIQQEITEIIDQL